MQKNIFQLSYWLNTRPGSLEPTVQKYFIVFIALLFVFLLFTIYLKNVKKGSYLRIWRRLNSFALGNFLIALFLLFFTHEKAVFLSARIWFLLWFAVMLAWMVFIYKDLKKIPEMRKKRVENEEYKKYIP